MCLIKTRTVFTRLAALFCLASTAASPGWTADTPKTPSRKDVSALAGKVREVGKLTSLPGAAAKLTFSLDGKVLVVESAPPAPSRPPVLGSHVFLNPKPTIRNSVWNLSSHHVAHLKPMAYQIGGSLLSPDGRSLAVWSGASGEHEFHDLATQRKVAQPRTWRWLKAGMEPLAFSPDGKMAAAKLARDAGIGLFDVATGKEISKITMDDNRWLSFLPGVVFSGDGKVLAVPLRDTKALAVCETASGKVLRRFDKFENGSVLAFTADGKRIALGNPKSEEVVMWEVASGKKISTWEGHKHGVTDLTFSAEDKVLFAASDREVLAWDVALEREAARMRGHQDTVTVLAVSPDGKRLASGGKDKSVHLWDISAIDPESKSRSQTPADQKP